MGQSSSSEQCIAQEATEDRPRVPSTAKKLAHGLQPESVHGEGESLLSDGQLAYWQTYGWLFLEGIWPTQLIAQAQKQTAAACASTISRSQKCIGEFPHGEQLRTLNDTTLHPRLLAIAAKLLDEDSYGLRLIQSQLFVQRAGGETLRNPCEHMRSYSSVWADNEIGTGHARSMLDSSQAWSAARNVRGEWLQLDLGRVQQIAGAVVQGRGDHASHQWVKSYNIVHSVDGETWSGELGPFEGSQGQERKEVNFSVSVSARFIRFVVNEWENHISMRAGVIISGDEHLAGHVEHNYPEGNRTYSSVWANDAVGMGHCRSMLGSKQAWSAAKNVVGEWLQIDLGAVKQVSGIVVQGRGDAHREQYVTKYTVVVSADGCDWSSELGEFSGSVGDEHVSSLFPSPVSARFVRLIAKAWHVHISMRAGVLLPAEPGDLEDAGNSTEIVWSSCKDLHLVPPAAEPEAVSVSLFLTGVEDSHVPLSFLPRGSNEAGSGQEALLYAPGAALLCRSDKTSGHSCIPRNISAKCVVQRMVLKSARAEWVQGECFVRSLSGFRQMRELTPSQRTALGFPRPGHPIWTRCGLNLAAQRYGLDTEPYLSASGSQLPLGQKPDRELIPPAPENAVEIDPNVSWMESARLVSPEEALGTGEDVLSPSQVKQWREQGWLLVQGIWPRELMDEAASVASELHPDPGKMPNLTFKVSRFPYDSSSLNHVTTHPRFLRAIEQLLDAPTKRLRISQAMCAGKVGPSEEVRKSWSAPSWSTQNQPMHQDYANNSLLVPARSTEQWGKPDEVTTIVYLDDHAGIKGGTCFVPGLRHSVSGENLYAVERRAAYTRGSVLFYTLGTWHRGTSAEPGRMRRVCHVVFRTQESEHIGGATWVGQPTAKSFHELKNKGAKFDVAGFLESLTPDQRAMLGFPAPESDYWNSHSIDDVRRHFDKDDSDKDELDREWARL